MFGWVGNFFLVLGSFLLGYKVRFAFLLIALGEFIWLFRSYQLAAWDMLAICVVFLILAIRNWWMWAPPPEMYDIIGHMHKIPKRSLWERIFNRGLPPIHGMVDDSFPWVVPETEEYKARKALTPTTAHDYAEVRPKGEVKDGDTNGEYTASVKRTVREGKLVDLVTWTKTKPKYEDRHVAGLGR